MEVTKQKELGQEEFTLADLIGREDLKDKVFTLADPTDPDHRAMRFQSEDYGALPSLPNKNFVLFTLSKINWPSGAVSVRGALMDGGEINQYYPLKQKIKEVKVGADELKNVMRLLEEKRQIAMMLPRYHSTIGADPEIFAVNEDGSLIPAFEFLPSKKQKQGVYWDGYQAEFEVVPDTCLAAFTSVRLRDQLKKLDGILRSKYPKARLTLKNTMVIPPERLENDEQKYVDFGCTPSKNAYGDAPFPDVDSRKVPFRSAGGHMHFSYQGDIPQAVKELDRILGVISVSLFQYYDTPQRRALYGRAGEYRTPSYGFEYRVLSNAWLCHPTMVHFVYECARNVLGYLHTHNKVWADWDITEEEARECINKVDVALAEKLLRRNERQLDWFLAGLKPIYPYFLKNRGDMHDESFQELLSHWKAMIFNGVHTYLNDPDYLSEAWELSVPDESANVHQCTMYNTSPLLLKEGKLRHE